MKSCKKIVILTGHFPSLVRFRGKLVRELADRGHEVIVYGPAEGLPQSSVALDGAASLRSIDFDRTGTNPFRDALAVQQIYRLLRSDRPDVLFSEGLKPTALAAPIGRIARVSQVALFTGLGYGFIDAPGIKRKLLRWFLVRLLAFGLRSADTVIFQNSDDRDLLNRSGVLRSTTRSVVVRGSGVDLEEFSPFPPRVEPVTFILVSRLILEKGIVEFVEAASNLKRAGLPIRAVIAGPLEHHPSAISREKLRDWCNGPAGIEYLGELNDVRPALRDCSVFVLPSWYREGVPRAALEAMSIGRAIITADSPGCKETVVPGINGFLVPIRDVPALTTAMQKFVAHPELIQAMAKESRRIAEELFDVRAINQSMIEASGLS